MSSLVRTVSLSVAVAVLCPMAAWAQYNSELVVFDGPPIDDPATSQEMFRIPEFSGSTSQYVIHNDAGQYNYNAAYRSSGLLIEGLASMYVFFNWVDPFDPNGWVRLSTHNGAERPNPSLHTQGKVRFKLVNKSEIIRGEIGICLGIRETGVNVGQLQDGGITGPIEWVGVTGIITDPNDPNTVIAPIPAITLPVSDNPQVPYELEWDLLTGVVTLDGVPQGGGIARFTGNGILDAPNDRGTLEHIAFTNLDTDAAVLIELAIDELQFEARVPDPVLPPTVVAPIIAGDEEVTVTDLMATVDQVSLYVNYEWLETRDVTTPDDVVFTIDPAVTDDFYTATQRDSVTGTTSDHSDPVTVLEEASPYSFSFVLDEDGDDCNYDPPGGWEFVPVTSVDSGPVPHGMDLFNKDGVWQTIDVPLDDDSLVLPWLGGNGAIDPSPTGVYSIDSIWFVIAPGAEDPGPHEVFIDAVEALDEFGQVIQTLHHMENGINYLENARVQSSTQPTTTELTTVGSYDGTTSHRLIWTYPSTDPDETLGMYHNIGWACATSPTFPDSTVTVRFHLLCRSDSTNTVPLPEVVGPIIVGNQDTVRILNDGSATAVQLYVNGDPVGGPVPPTGTETDFSGLSLTPDDSVSATQTLPAGESDLAYPRGVNAIPLPPTVASPISPGSDEVTVYDVVVDVPYASASLVTVLVNGDPHGTAVPSGDTVVVPLDIEVATGNVVTATQTVNDATSLESEAVVVAYTAPAIYKVPAEADGFVTVMAMHPDADNVTVVVNGTIEFSDTPDPGVGRWDVPVSGLVAGDTVTAYYSVGGVQSIETGYDMVTSNVTTQILCDDFEYSQAEYEAAWADTGYPRLELVDTKNATPGGQKSLYAPIGDSRVDAQIAPLIPTEIEPVIINVDVYDEVGIGNSAVQFAQLTGDLDLGDWFLMEVGILGWANTDNIHYDFRAIGNGGPSWVDLDQYDGPDRSMGWHNFTVVHKGNRFDVYVDGLLSYKNLELTDETTYEFARIGAAPYSAGTAYFDDYCVEVGPVRFGEVPPPPATIAAPIEDGDEAVTVTGVDLSTTLLQIVDQGSNVIGSYSDPVDPNGVVDITLTRPLVHLERITAEMTTTDWGVLSSEPLEAGKGNGDILVCIGVRETDDSGPLGSEGSDTGDIEWIGASSEVNGAPQGVPISPSNSWQMLIFDPNSAAITGFTGDGVIDVARGTLEHLAVTVNAASPDRSSGPYQLYVDNVVNVGAGTGGSDFVITDFEGFAVGTEVLFQEPTYSGSTSQHLAPLPSASEVSSIQGNPGQSELLVWFWKDTGDQRWARITTYSAIEMPSPIIDLTKPIQMDVLLVETAGIPGDVDGDGDVDLADLAALLTAYATCEGDPNYNPNADFNNDDCVNLADLAILLSNYGT